MSADNGIYILNLKDQSRVIHAQAIENLWWSFVTFDSDSDEMIPTRVVDYYRNAAPMTRREAQDTAFKMEEDYIILEYGISTFNIDKTWDELVERAKRVASLEIKTITSRPAEEWERKSDWFGDEIKILEEILKM